MADLTGERGGRGAIANSVFSASSCQPGLNWPPLETLLVGIKQVKPRHDVRTVGQACRLLVPFQPFRAGILPPALSHEGIPNLNLLLARLAAMLETPAQDLQVGAAT